MTAPPSDPPLLPGAAHVRQVAIDLVGIEGEIWSAKVRPGSFIDDRHLVTLAAGAAPGAIAKLTAELGLAVDRRAVVEREAATATAIHIGVEATTTTTTTKIYFEHPIGAAGASDDLAHLAVKWRVGDGVAPVRVERYVRVGRQTSEQAAARVAAAFAAGADSPGFHFASSVLDLDDRSLADPDWGFLTVESEATARRSFDFRTSLVDALPMSLIATLLDRACTDFSAPAPGAAWWERRRDETVVRIAGGTDGHGEDFVTIYYAPRFQPVGNGAAASLAPVRERRASPGWALDERPSLAPEVIGVPVEDHLVLAHEPGTVVLLDPLLRVICESLDGENTVEELATDIADAAGVTFEMGRERVDTLLSALELDGLLLGQAAEPAGSPDQTPNPNAATARFGDPTASIQVSGAAAFVDAIRSDRSDPIGDGPAPTHSVELDDTSTPARLLVEHRVVWAGEAGEASVTAASGAVTGLLRSDDPSIIAFALVRSDAALLVHPHLADRVVSLLDRLEEIEIVPAAGGVFSITGLELTPSLTHADWGSDTAPNPLRPSGLLAQSAWDRPELVRQTISLGSRLDAMTVGALSELLDQLTPVVVAPDAGDDEVIRVIDQHLPAAEVDELMVDLFGDDDLPGDDPQP